MNSVLLVIAGAILLAILVYIWLPKANKNKQNIAQNQDQNMSDQKTNDNNLGVKQGIKFGFGFAIGFTLWLIVAGAISAIFWGSMFVGMFRTMMPGGVNF